MLQKAISMAFDPTMFYYEPDKIVAPYSQTKYLVLSSLFFFMASVYGFINNQLLYGIISLITSIVSVNFWRDATYSYRRCLDLITARISFIIFFFSGSYYASQNKHDLILFVWFSVVLLSIYCYYLSHKTYDVEDPKNNRWYKYHAMFHFLCFCGMVITIKTVIDHKKIENIKI